MTNMKLLRILVLPAILALSAPAALAASTARTITVQGTGTVTTVPDEADFGFGVTVTGRTARSALTANSARMNALIAAIKKQGIPGTDIQTSQISLSPNMNENGTKIIDFTAANSVTVKTHAIAKAGAIVDAAVAAGANLVSGPTLTISDQRALQRRALKAAIADARSRALAIAAAAHVRLGAVSTVTETSSSPIPFESVAKAGAAVGTPVEPGTVKTEEDVTVTFSIR